MPQELGLPVYLEKDAEPGSKIVVAGEYCGSVMGAKYNNLQHNFFEISGDHRHIILSGGQLDWRAEQGHLEEGKVYDVVFEGKKEIEKGQWKGSESKNYGLAVYSPSEVADLLKKSGGELRGKVTEAPVGDVADVRSADATESLDNLE